MKKKFIGTYLLLLFFSLCIMIIDSKEKVYLSDRLYNFFSFNIRDLINKWTRSKELERENSKLLKEIAELSYEKQSYQTLKKENQKLKKILKFQTQYPKSIIPCRIINRLPEEVNLSYLIGKGASQGIRENAPVISSKGVFGKVLKVGRENSLVSTLKNYNVALSALDTRSNVKGIFRWDKKFYLEGVPQYADVKSGDTIVTSSKGSVFPEGLPIGRLVRVSKDEANYSLKIEIEPFEDFSDVDVVFVIKE
ncbi:MAG: rod shape-determining protein MreC [candidate division WOR-3 bacterium]|nr:rod shape-determining protein MreC [candidate division WOR-3 bacterium]